MNTSQFYKSLIHLLIALFFASVSSYLLNKYSILISPFWWISIVFYTFIFLVLNIVYNLKHTAEAFSQLLLATLIIKLVLALILVLIMRVTIKDAAFNFSMHFLIHYVLFTIFEMRYLLKLIKFKTTHKL